MRSRTARSPLLPYLWAAFGCLVILLGFRFSAGLYLHEGAEIPGDFHVYWRACERLAKGTSFYVASDGSPYKYSPTFTYLFYGSFFHLPERAAASLWMFVSVAVYFTGLGALTARLLEMCARPRIVAAGLFLGIFLGWRGFLETLSYGQADLILAGAIFFLASLRPGPRRVYRSAAAWAVILVIKPHMGIVLLPFFLVSGLREATCILLAVSLAYLMPALWLGPARLFSLFGEWIHCLRVQQDPVFLTNNINQSLPAVLARTAGLRERVGDFTAATLLTYVILMTGIAIRLGVKKLRNGYGEVCTRVGVYDLALAVYLVISPLSWRWLAADWGPLLAAGLALGVGPLWYLPWFLAAVSSQRLVAEATGLAAQDGVSFYGVFLIANICLLVPALRGLQLALGSRRRRSPSPKR